MRSRCEALSLRSVVHRRRMAAGVVGAAVLAATAFTAGALMIDPAPAPLLATFASNDSSEAGHTAIPAEPLDVPSVNMELATVGNVGPAVAESESGTLVVATPSELATDDSEIRWFNGRPIRPARTIRMTVTAYSPDERSCGASADGITASGYSVWTNGMRLVAADTSVLPFGSLVSVPGYDNGSPVPVLDRGGLIKGNRLDVLYGSHAEARQWGVQTLDVTVWEYADGEGAKFRTAHRRRG